MDVKKEITNATMRGIAGKTSTPETGKCKVLYLRKSTASVWPAMEKTRDLLKGFRREARDLSHKAW
jgi:hypothetical protein